MTQSPIVIKGNTLDHPNFSANYRCVASDFSQTVIWRVGIESDARCTDRTTYMGRSTWCSYIDADRIHRFVIKSPTSCPITSPLHVEYFDPRYQILSLKVHCPPRGGCRPHRGSCRRSWEKRGRRCSVARFFIEICARIQVPISVDNRRRWSVILGVAPIQFMSEIFPYAHRDRFPP